MRYLRAMVAILALALSGCLGAKQPLNPPQLVTDRETDMAVQLFMQATLLMAKYYGFSALDYDAVRVRSEKAGFIALPFMPPVSTRATPRFNLETLRMSPLNGVDNTAYRVWVDANGGYPMLLKYYVNTGWRAAQIVCRNYLLGLDEKNQYLEFLQKEFNIAFGLANTILVLADANGTLRTAFGISQTAINDGVNAYQDYRFLPIVDREAARELVEAA